MVERVAPREERPVRRAGRAGAGRHGWRRRSDGLDRCPNTIVGGEVDANGCLRKTSQTIVIDDVPFELGSAELTERAKKTLDAAAESLVVEPDVKFEVAGHTDSSGSDELNQRLSRSARPPCGATSRVAASRPSA